jgi:hypothetical protein
MRRLAVLTLTLSALIGATSAEALTTREIIELSRAGLGEDVLLALIEVDRGVYAIDPASMKALKEAKVSERVILALVRSGREPLAAPEPPVQVAEPPVEPSRPEPQVVVIEHREPEIVREVVPVYVAVGSGHRRLRTHVPAATQEPFIPFQSGPPVIRPVTPQPKEPVYWGFGGKLRSDAWKPDHHKSDRDRGRDRDRDRDKSDKK